MPEEFDPAWEYRVDDPEIAEAMRLQVRLPTIALLPQCRSEGSNLKDIGFRFGRGNPDYPKLRLAPAKPERPPAKPKPKKQQKPRRKANEQTCRCGIVYRAPPSRRREFCSKRCAAMRSKSSRPCEWCEVEFIPNRPKQRFCEVACVRCWTVAKRIADGSYRPALKTGRVSLA